MTDERTIDVDQFLTHPPRTVWRALTEPEILAMWWALGDVAPVVGHAFTLDMGGFGQQPCTVTRVEPETLFAHTFAEGSLDSTLTWTLHPEGTGTRLHLAHSGLDVDTPMGRQAFTGMGAGWPRVLANMESALTEV
ncbi:MULTISPECIES: SRPBCC family protein [Brevibacterium]|uniref:Activator of Hsp90 ATPase homolog 1-like protein n=1 Tax=Brevibacterium casei TaxID=33889 RepID=A0A165E818_9MICO|nr:SRPBCC domain-containing protein [Brevibacterium casei]KZE20862.1 polyketide cyclase [Brevibacterium casei]QPS32641.1 SRPBCC domain-containing protein [Brevibacterium casei]VEW11899.1 Activator of Hsp90 ATPase homolog 1-like protein [Brevibacterium casei]